MLENGEQGIMEATKDIGRRSKQVSPTRSHSCTDILCLLLFVLFALGQAVLSILIYSSGANPSEFLLPHDSSGRTCRSPTSSLFYLDIAACINVDVLLTSCRSTSVCVTACPSENLFYLIASHRQIMYQYYCESSSLNAYFANNPPTSVNQSMYYTLASLGICPLYAIASTPLFGRCLPTFLSTTFNQSEYILAVDSTTNQSMTISDLSQPLTFGLISQATQYFINLMNVKTFGMA